jgi:hypothetical protein
MCAYRLIHNKSESEVHLVGVLNSDVCLCLSACLYVYVSLCLYVNLRVVFQPAVGPRVRRKLSGTETRGGLYFPLVSRFHCNKSRLCVCFEQAANKDLRQVGKPVFVQRVPLKR